MLDGGEVLVGEGFVFQFRMKSQMLGDETLGFLGVPAEALIAGEIVAHAIGAIGNRVPFAEQHGRSLVVAFAVEQAPKVSDNPQRVGQL